VLAASLDRLGRTQEAERTFSAAYAQGNDAILAGQYATFLARQGRLETALRVVQQERARSPADARLRALEQRIVADVSR
jgi:Flp pilus assembly protein TadD